MSLIRHARLQECFLLVIGHGPNVLHAVSYSDYARTLAPTGRCVRYQTTLTPSIICPGMAKVGQGSIKLGPDQEGTQGISPVDACFLCSPDPELVYFVDDIGFALCGLGPIVDGYSVVGTTQHVRSAEEAAEGGLAPGFLTFASDVRNRLISEYGSCLLTEHGRMPVCGTETGDADTHCYHAHFLMFPRVKSVDAEARTHFEQIVERSTLKDALRTASSSENYFLLSPAPDRFLVMTQPRREVRQFARFLVARSMGHPEDACWRRKPERSKAVSMARRLRSSAFQTE